MAKHKRALKIGDIISPKSYYQGFDNAVIKMILPKCYRCKIPCGIADIPKKTVEEIYEWVGRIKKKRR